MFRRKWSLAAKALAMLALASGGTAFLLVRGYANRLDALRPVTGAPVEILVAAHELARGTVLAENDLTQRAVPSAFAPPGAVRSATDVSGRVLASGLAAGEPLTRTRLAGAGAGPVAALVPSGLRAFPIAAGIPPGAVRPGDLVDVLATFGGPHPYTDTVAQGLQVLRVIGADQGSGLTTMGSGTTPTLIVLVEPDQAERVAYAVAFGKISVTVAPPPSGFPG